MEFSNAYARALRSRDGSGFLFQDKGLEDVDAVTAELASSGPMLAWQQSVGAPVAIAVGCARRWRAFHRGAPRVPDEPHPARTRVTPIGECSGLAPPAGIDRARCLSIGVSRRPETRTLLLMQHEHVAIPQDEAPGRALCRQD